MDLIKNEVHFSNTNNPRLLCLQLLCLHTTHLQLFLMGCMDYIKISTPYCKFTLPTSYTIAETFITMWIPSQSKDIFMLLKTTTDEVFPCQNLEKQLLQMSNQNHTVQINLLIKEKADFRDKKYIYS